METPMGVYRWQHPTGLNRTMQYGNYIYTFFHLYSRFCLNRTMQYGNLQPDTPMESRTAEFKSYYVVWKQIYFLDFDVKANGLNRTMQYGNPALRMKNTGRTILFKSYYVVWKLTSSILVNSSLFGLNRTMQYGNVVLFVFSPADPSV